MSEPEGDAPPPLAPILSIEAIERLHWVLLAAAVAAAFAIPSASPASVAAGGAFMGANVNLMKHLLRRVLRPGGPSLAPAMILLVLKFCLFLGLLVLLFERIPIEGLSFAAGATVFLFAAVIGALRTGGTAQGDS
jgi:hypothetical protein